MGNVCQCMCNQPPTSHIDIIVDDTREMKIRHVQTEATRIEKIRFILPVIKVTDETNDVKLIYDPAVDSNIQTRRKSSKQGTTIITPSPDIPASPASSEFGTPRHLSTIAEAQVHTKPPREEFVIKETDRV